MGWLALFGAINGLANLGNTPVNNGTSALLMAVMALVQIYTQPAMEPGSLANLPVIGALFGGGSAAGGTAAAAAAPAPAAA